jgi:uncharacterized protein (TIGR02145 family)
MLNLGIKFYSNSMIKSIYVIVFMTITYTLGAQSISEVQALRNGNFIKISYKLDCESKNFISLYTSMDGGKNWIGPLKSVTGDVGAGISSGQRLIVWNVFQDMNEFIGDSIVFKVIAGYIKSSFVDIRDLKTYKTVVIGRQIWMSENLNFDSGRGSVCSGNVMENCEKYGRLYSWEAAKKACPVGWHLPSESEWNILISILGGKNTAGTKLKSKAGWGNFKADSINISGFSALPGGFRNKGGSSSGLGVDGYWWTESEYDANDATYVNIKAKDPEINLIHGDKKNSGSIRCISN